jgi:Phosphate-selective porin O and P
MSRGGGRRLPLFHLKDDAPMKTMTAHCSALLLCATLCSGAQAADPAAAQVEDRLEQQIRQMQQQLDSMKSQLDELRTQNAALSEQQQRQSARAPETTPPAVVSAISPNLSLWGYGEIYYMHPTSQGAKTEFDLARAVFGIGYRFDERTTFNSEFEVEHAVSSADDRGEFEVEQFYVDRELADWVSAKAGLFLMPFGLLNEHHEPTNFYGVQRNFVETLIIPSTWREGGVGFHGDLGLGLHWDAGVTTGPDLGSWDPNPENPLYRTAFDLEASNAAPLQATHQELQFANAQHLSQYLSVNYSGVPGLLTGAAVFTGKAAVPSSPAGLPDQRVTLWEGHARWTPGAADLSAVYAQGRISHTGPFNLANAGGSNPMPSKFQGYYLQGAYTVWQQGEVRLSPFLRWEHYDMGAGYEGIAPGFTPVPAGLAADGRPWPQLHDRVWTVGANLYPDSHVVLKVDYQRFDVNGDFNRFDLGLGLNF